MSAVVFIASLTGPRNISSAGPPTADNVLGTDHLNRSSVNTHLRYEDRDGAGSKM